MSKPATQINYEHLFRLLPGMHMVFEARAPYRIIAENKRHEGVAMVQPGEIIGRPFFEVFPDTTETYKKTGVSDLEESFKRVVRTRAADTMPTLHYDIKSPDGTFVERYWRVTHHPILGDDGEVSLIFQDTADITEEIKAGEELARMQGRLEDALAVGKISAWVWDIPTDRIIGDKWLAQMFGLSEEEVTKGLPLDAFINGIHPEDRARVQKEIQRTIKRGDTFEHEYRTINADGTVRWVIARGRIEKDHEGKPLAFPGALVDITERKIAENNLRFLSQASALLASSLDYRKTLKAITKLVVPSIADWCTVDVIDPEKGVQLMAVAHKDPAKVRWAKELRKQQPVDMQAPTGLPKVLRTGEPEFYPKITDELIKASTPNKKQLELITSLGLRAIIIVPLKVSGKTVGALTLVSAGTNNRYYTDADLEMAEDLADRMSLAMTNAHLYETAQQELRAREALQEELREANERLEARVRERTAQLEEMNLTLERSNRELQDFAYVASHDLQEPLRKIQAFGNLLMSEYEERLGEGRDYLERMRNAAARMSSLIEGLLSFSRVTTQAKPFSAVNLAVVADEVIGDLETRIEETEGIVTVENLPTIQADPVQMRQLLQNLIANALKFHRPHAKPVVRVSASVEKDTASGRRYCTLVVEDNGVGFDEKYLDRIFAVFQRLHGRESYEGTGIGLAVCRKIVERHDGSITAKSKTGVGSTFIVRLPMRHGKGKRTA